MRTAPWLWIALGSALGGVARYGWYVWMARVAGPTFPWGTLGVNIIGSFAIGWFAAATAPGARWPATAEIRQFLMPGLCGGFTTFSAFSLDTLNLIQAGELGRAFAYAAVSVVVCLAAVWAGNAIGR